MLRLKCLLDKSRRYLNICWRSKIDAKVSLDLSRPTRRRTSLLLAPTSHRAEIGPSSPPPNDPPCCSQGEEAGRQQPQHKRDFFFSCFFNRKLQNDWATPKEDAPHHCASWNLVEWHRTFCERVLCRVCYFPEFSTHIVHDPPWTCNFLLIFSFFRDFVFPAVRMHRQTPPQYFCFRPPIITDCWKSACVSTLSPSGMSSLHPKR